jgi:hypothetical protein
MKPKSIHAAFLRKVCVYNRHNKKMLSHLLSFTRQPWLLGLTRLKLLHGSDVGALDVVLEALDLLLELVEGDLVVLDDQVDLELLDAEADGDELGATPNETVLLDGTDALLELLHGGLIVCEYFVSIKCHERYCNRTEHTPGLNVKGDNGLGGRLHLALLLLLVLLDTGGLELLVLLVILVVGAEEVDLIVILLLSLLGSLGGVEGELLRAGAVGGELLRGVAGELGELGLVGGDVLVPAVGEGVLLNGGSLLDLLEGLHIGLGGAIAGDAVSYGSPGGL